MCWGEGTVSNRVAGVEGLTWRDFKGYTELTLVTRWGMGGEWLKCEAKATSLIEP